MSKKTFEMIGICSLFLLGIIFSSVLLDLDSLDVLNTTKSPISSGLSYPYPSSIDMNEGTKENSNYAYLDKDDLGNNEIDLNPSALPRNLDWGNWLNEFQPWTIVDRSSTQHLRTCDMYDTSSSMYCRVERQYAYTTSNMYFSFRFYMPNSADYLGLQIYDTGTADSVLLRMLGGNIEIYYSSAYHIIGTFSSNQLVHIRTYMNLATDRAQYWIDDVYVGEYPFRFSLSCLKWLKFETGLSQLNYHVYIDSPVWTTSADEARATFVPASQKDYSLDSEITFDTADLTETSLQSLLMRYSNTEAVTMSIQLYDFNSLTFDEITTKSFTSEDSFTLNSIGSEYVDSNQLIMKISGESYSNFIMTLDTLYITLNTNEFNGIQTFSTDLIGADPWTLYSTGTASILEIHVSHSKVYELDNASRGLALTHNMDSDWTIESYIMIQNIGYGSGCVMLNLYGDSGKIMQFGYNQTGGYWAKNYTGITGTSNIQSLENWTSNSWMHWCIKWIANSNNFQFIINDTLLNTHNFADFNSLAGIAVDAHSWGDAGKVWIDSFSWSWHPNYYDRMIFDPLGNTDADSDGMPNIWEYIYGLNPHLASDASGDADGDRLTNLDEFLYQTNPNDRDTDHDMFDDKFEVDYGTDPNDSTSYPALSTFLILISLAVVVLIVGMKIAKGQRKRRFAN